MTHKLWPEVEDEFQPQWDRDDWTAEEEAEHELIMEERQLDRRWRRVGESE